MKWATSWWGIQIMADSDEDAELLMALQAKLPEHTQDCYENGILKEATPTDSDCFDGDAIANSPVTLEFQR